MYQEKTLPSPIEFGIHPHSKLHLPERKPQPRHQGITIAMDVGIGTRTFHDIVDSHSSLIDFIKFGWGTCLVTKDIKHKIAILREQGIPFFFGGSLFEKYAAQNKILEFVHWCKQHGCLHIEVSNGSIAMNSMTKSRHVRELSEDFIVFAEVGFKDNDRSLRMHPGLWVEDIKRDIDAGAFKVITEAREGGNSGICRADGEIRYGLIEEIIDSDIDSSQLVFEAPNKDLQTYFVKKIGCNVNLANIGMNDLVAQETIRLGLRSDSLVFTEELCREKC
jgi:phosphosulfolactate synthase